MLWIDGEYFEDPWGAVLACHLGDNFFFTANRPFDDIKAYKSIQIRFDLDSAIGVEQAIAKMRKAVGLGT